MTREIPLTKGKVAIVDGDDYNRLTEYNWHFTTHGYAGRRKTYEFKRHKVAFLHREVLRYGGELDVDHINGDKLDNRKINLRLVTHRQNCFNTRIKSDNSSGYKGVSWCKQKVKWRVRVKRDGKEYHAGFYDNPIEAARAYNVKALELFGEYARLNIIPDEHTA